MGANNGNGAVSDETTEMTLSVDRFERRLGEEVAGLRVEMARQGADLRTEIAAMRLELKADLHHGFAHVGEEFALLRKDMSSMREQMARDQFELLKWSFLFWVGQFFAVAALMVTMVRVLVPSR